MRYPICLILLLALHVHAARIDSNSDEDETNLEHPNLDNLVVETVTKYPPRPTTSAPQWYLRSLCKTPRGKFPHPLDCHKYLDCWDGRVLERLCPNDLVFSDLGEYCDYLEYADCGTRPVIPTYELHYELIPSLSNQQSSKKNKISLLEESLTIIKNEPATRQDQLSPNDVQTYAARRRQIQKIIRRRLQ